jgi:hypothetical protein
MVLTFYCVHETEQIQNILLGGFLRMFETSKLRGRIIEKFGSQQAFAKAAKNSVSFISQYLNGRKFLDQRTMEKWIDLLEIPAAEISSYFFTLKVHETERKCQNG